MKNIHIIPTDKPTKLIQKRITKEIKLSSLNNPQLWDNIHIYITNDDIVEDGYAFNSFNNTVYKIVPNNSSREVLAHPNNLPLCAINKEHYYKIILTTDQDLIKDGVQVIDDKFLEYFVNNPSCEFVEIERNEIFGRNSPLDRLGFTIIKYKINMENIRPSQKMVDYFKKEQEIILKDKQPFYCSDRLELDDDEKCTTQCVVCSKQETVEETIKEHDYLQGFINQFQEGGEHQELSNNEWNVSDFLHWLKLNKFKIVKNEKIL